MQNLFYYAIVGTFLSCTNITGKIAHRPDTHPELSSSAQDHYINALLHKYHLTPQKSPFTKRNKTEVYSTRLGSARPLPEEFEAIAINVNKYLDSTTFYRDKRLLFNVEKVRSYQFSQKNKKELGVLLEATTDDGETIKGTLLDRKSSTLLVVGPGFTNHRELMAMHGDLFNSVDVLTFDFRGHGFEKTEVFKPSTWKSLSQQLIGIDRKKVRLGQCEELDVHAIVTKACERKKYSSVVGLGICYSGLIFVKTAALYPNLFNKLVLDSCWFSLQHAVDIIAKDPGLIARPQAHSWLANNIVVKQRWFQKLLVWLGQKFLDVDFNTVSALDYAPRLREDLPVLFIHGKDDLLVPLEQLETLFHATNCRQKTAVITSNPHVRNYHDEKEVFKEIVDLFMNTSYEQFNHLLINPTAYADYKSAQITQPVQCR